MPRRSLPDSYTGWWLAGLFALALVARGVGFAHLGLEHFDEGVYAISGLWPFASAQTPPFYVAQRFYAPALLPFLIGLSYLSLGVSDVAAIAVSLLAGALTVVAVWWVGRRWYGPPVGLAAACLAALSDFHIVYSRMALTDVLLTLWVVLATGLFAEALARGSWRWAVAAGLVTALAWNTKYNGWLPVAFGALAVAAAPAGKDPAASRGARWRRGVACWGLAAGAAAIGYLPWFLYVQHQPGGYAAVLAHHRNYVMGWGAWWSNLQAHAAMQTQFEGVASRLAVGAAYVLVAVLRWPADNRARILTALAGGAIFAAAWQCSATAVLAAATLVLVVFELRRPTVATWVHVGWLGLLLVLTPLYHPYARLAQPLLPALWIGTGALFARWLVPALEGETQFANPAESKLSRRIIAWIVPGVSVLMGGWLIASPTALPHHDVWMPTDDVRIAVEKIAERVPEGAALLVNGEPPVVFYLGGRGIPVESLETLERIRTADRSRDVFVIVGPHAKLDRDGRAYLERHREQSLQRVESCPLSPSLAVQLDLLGPGRSAPTAHGDFWRLELYQVRR